MNGVKDKVWFLREGLFAKYVIALVGLVVFVLAVNGAMEIWISYRGIKTSVTDGMSEKAAATAKRIQQSITDLERQISRVTRVSSNSLELAAPTMRCCWVGVLHQSVDAALGQWPRATALTRQTVTFGSNADFSRDLRFTETATRGNNFTTSFKEEQPCCRSRCPIRTTRSPSPKSICVFWRISSATARSASSALPISWMQRPGAGEFDARARYREGPFAPAASRRDDQGARRHAADRGHR